MAQLALIPKEHAHLDLLSLGALVVRLDPGVIPFEYASQLDIPCLRRGVQRRGNLSRAFGQRTAIASAMVDYPIGLKIEAEVRRMGGESLL
jgi:2-dehydro-3-deoxygluconokinase